MTKVKKTCAKKSSKALVKTATRKIKDSMILEKSETKDKFSVDDSQSKEVISTSVDMPQETIEISSEVTLRMDLSASFTEN